MKIHHTLTIQRPPSDLYAFWRKLENLSRLVPGKASAVAVSDRRSHWRTRLPGGRTIEWDAEITNDTPGRLITWQSLPGSEVENTGAVRFTPAGPSGSATSVDLTIEYTPPGGTLGRIVGQLASRHIDDEVRAGLEQVKTRLETG